MNFHQIEQIAKRPEDFKVLERVPLTCGDISFPLVLDCVAGDEISIVVLDVETTGFDPNENALTELGLTSLLYSPSLGKITSIVASGSWYQDPMHPIPTVVQELTGITDDCVRGKKIEFKDISSFFSGNTSDPLVIAHNAAFDRSFAEKYIEGFPTDLRWACSIKQVNWSAAKFSSKMLEYILIKLGFFYDGHRANTDTLALSFVFMQRPELLNELVQNSSKRTVIIRAFNSPYNVKDQLKDKGFTWSPDDNGSHQKHWYITCEESNLAEQMLFLNSLYDADKNVGIEFLDARVNFKHIV